MSETFYRFQIGENVLVERRGEWHGGQIVSRSRAGRFWPIDRYTVRMADDSVTCLQDWQITKIHRPIAFTDAGRQVHLVVDNDLLPSEIDP